MDKFKEIAKNNLLSIICGVVALLAVAAWFWPIDDMYTGLVDGLKQQVTVATNLLRIMTQPRKMPMTTLNKDQPDSLMVFPNEKVTNAGVKAVSEIRNMSNAMRTQVQTANQKGHKLAVEGELPDPGQTQKFNFAGWYEQHILDPVDDRYRKILNAGVPLSLADITAATAALKTKIDKEHIIINPVTNQPDPQSVAEAAVAFQKAQAGFELKLQTDRAGTLQCYLMPATGLGNGKLGGPLGPCYNDDLRATKLNEPPPDVIWDAQLNLWIMDDVCNAIARTNDTYSEAGSKDVTHSVVKQLVSIAPPQPVMVQSALLPPGSPQPASPAANAADAGGKLPSDFTLSPTGRVTNSLYVVYSFEVTVDVDAAKASRLIEQLEYGQFITVTNVSKFDLLDPATMAAAKAADVANAGTGGFIYGDRPVVRVTLQCEELLMRDWLNPLMPHNRDVLRPGSGSGTIDTGRPPIPGQGPGYRDRGSRGE